MSFLKAIVDRAETAFDAIGMGEGALAPVARAGAGFALGTIAWGYLDPHLTQISYTADGSTRPWALTASSGDANQTMFPWWVPGAGLALLFGGFV